MNRRDGGPGVHVQNDDFDVDGRRIYWLDRPWSVHAPGKAPIYFRRWRNAFDAAFALASDMVGAGG